MKPIDILRPLLAAFIISANTACSSAASPPVNVTENSKFDITLSSKPSEEIIIRITIASTAHPQDPLGVYTTEEIFKTNLDGNVSFKLPPPSNTQVSCYRITGSETTLILRDKEMVNARGGYRCQTPPSLQQQP